MTSLATDDTATAAKVERLIRFASDALDLADRRADLDLCALIDDLHARTIGSAADRTVIATFDPSHTLGIGVGGPRRRPRSRHRCAV